jgi:hypothetical protein
MNKTIFLVLVIFLAFIPFAGAVPSPYFVSPTPNNMTTVNGAKYFLINVSDAGTISSCILTNSTGGISPANYSMTVDASGTYCYINLTTIYSPIDYQVYVNDGVNTNATEYRTASPFFCGVVDRAHSIWILDRDYNCTDAGFTINSYSILDGRGHYVDSTSYTMQTNGESWFGASTWFNSLVYNITLYNGIASSSNAFPQGYSQIINSTIYSDSHGTARSRFGTYSMTPMLQNVVLYGYIYDDLSGSDIVIRNVTAISTSPLGFPTFEVSALANNELYIYDSTIFGALKSYGALFVDKVILNGMGRSWCIQFGFQGYIVQSATNSIIFNCTLAFVGGTDGSWSGNTINSTIGADFIDSSFSGIFNDNKFGTNNILAMGSRSDAGCFFVSNPINNTQDGFADPIMVRTSAPLNCTNINGGNPAQVLLFTGCPYIGVKNVNTKTILIHRNNATIENANMQYFFDTNQYSYGTNSLVNNSVISNYANLTYSRNITLLNVTVPVINNIGNNSQYYRKWYVVYRVVDADGYPISADTINIKNVFATQVYSSTNKITEATPQTQYYDDKGSVTTYEPYNISGTKAGYVPNYTSGITFSSDAHPILQLSKIPTITIHSPISRKYAKYVIDLNVSADTIINTWWHNINNTANVTFTPNSTINLTSMGDGEYTVYVYANGTTGIQNYSKVYFTVDTTRPLVFITSPTNGTVIDLIESGAKDVSIIGIGENIHLDSVWTSNPDFGANLGTSENWKFTYSNTPDGSYSITIYVNDTYGNIGEAEVNFIVKSLFVRGNALFGGIIPLIIALGLIFSLISLFVSTNLKNPKDYFVEIVGTILLLMVVASALVVYFTF